jgi:hypothetical protein
MRTEGVQQEGEQFLNCNLFVAFEDADGIRIPTPSGQPVFGTAPLVGTNDWRTVETVVVPPDGAASATVGCFLSCTGTAWFDEVVFQPLVIPIWNTAETERFLYMWEGADGPPPEAVKGNAENLLEMEELLGETLEAKVRFHRYASNARKGEVTGVSGNAHVQGLGEIHTIYWSDRHEIVHLLTRRWKGGIGLLGEGLAVHLSGAWRGQPVSSWPAKLAKHGELVPISALVRTADFRRHSDLVTYPQSGSFVEFLLKHHGVATFKTIYEATDQTTDAEAFDAVLTEVTGKGLAEHERAWRVAVGVDKPDPAAPARGDG